MSFFTPPAKRIEEQILYAAMALVTAYFLKVLFPEILSGDSAEWVLAVSSGFAITVLLTFWRRTKNWLLNWVPAGATCGLIFGTDQDWLTLGVLSFMLVCYCICLNENKPAM